jgi:colanic acid/amylovoran biosynthesis glycosyltransferase
MKICIITTRFPQRSTTFITQHAVGLAKRGHQVTVLSRAPEQSITPEELKYLDSLNIRRFHTPSLPGSFFANNIVYLKRSLQCPRMFRHWLRPSYPWRPGELFNTHEYHRALQQIQPDVIHVHFGQLTAQLSQFRSVSKVITTWHGYDANQITRERGNDVYREFFQKDHIHTVGSQFMQRRLQELGAKESNLRLVPMGIDLNRFTYKDRDVPLGKPLQLLSVGRLHEMKGHRYLIDAIRLLRDRSIDVHLKIIGDGELRQDLQNQIRSLNLDDRVQLLGARLPEAILQAMHDANLFALTGVHAGTGHVETQGVVFAEAQATGLPVIASDVGGSPESLIHGKTGFLCQEKDPSAIAEAITRFVHDPLLLKTFGHDARAFVESRFSLDHMLDSFEQIYREIH